MQDNTQLDYRDPEWVAQRLGLDKNTVYKYLQDGTFPGLQLGRKWLISERRLAEFLDGTSRRQTEQRRSSAASLRPAFAGFDERAGSAMESARHEAITLNQGHVGTEHLLLGLLRDPGAVACQALSDLDLDLGALAQRARTIVPPGPAPIAGDPALTPRAKNVLSLAVDEARRLKQEEIGTEHLLVGLLAVGEGMGWTALTEAGVTLDSARAAILRRHVP